MGLSIFLQKQTFEDSEIKYLELVILLINLTCQKKISKFTKLRASRPQISVILYCMLKHPDDLPCKILSLWNDGKFLTLNKYKSL